MKPVCYLDLDGVIVDFVSGALRLHNATLSMKDVRWDFWKQIVSNEATFWSGMGHDFWANLGFTAEGRGVLEVVEAHFGANVVLLTSPCMTPGGVEGKVAWVQKNLPNYRRRLFVGPSKHLLAGPGKVLVDDNEENVHLFQHHGGTAVLVPRPWNHRRWETNPDGSFSTIQLAAEIEDALEVASVH